MKKAIINADDFGLCPAVNEGIILAHRQGILTSATLMANTSGFEQAVALARENPALGVGLHLNIVRGRPVSPPETIPTLLGPDGRFPSEAGRIIRRVATRRIKPAEIERDLRAQIEKVLAAGRPLTHFDSEKHMHALPPVFKVALKLGAEYGIRKIRFIREYSLSRRISRSAKAAFLSLCCRSMKRRVLAAGFVITDAFYGICNSGRMNAAVLRRLVRRLGEGTTEIMVHPGFRPADPAVVEAEVGRYYINDFRELELQALLDPGLPAIARASEVEWIGFNGI
jgi:hopanoid biosynthesis associated protein HpnK